MSDKELLLVLTRDILDLKREKKDYNKDINDRIKGLELQIKSAVLDDTVKMF